MSTFLITWPRFCEAYGNRWQNEANLAFLLSPDSVAEYEDGQVIRHGYEIVDDPDVLGGELD